MGKKATRVVLDTNVLISAVGWTKGSPNKVLKMVIEGKAELFISRAQFEEISRVLEYPKLKFTKKQRRSVLRLLSATATLVEPEARLEIVKEDPSDNRILECAVAADADFVVSGDKHLLAIRVLAGGTRIVKPVAFLRLQAGRMSRPRRSP